MPKTQDGGFLLDEGNPTPYGAKREDINNEASDAKEKGDYDD